MAEERVQKILARSGYGSRRSSEELILSGRVSVNGKPAILGTKADASRDVISVDGQKIPQQPSPVYIALHKPQGVLSDIETHDDPRKTVRDLIPLPGHLFSVIKANYQCFEKVVSDGCEKVTGIRKSVYKSNVTRSAQC